MFYLSLRKISKQLTILKLEDEATSNEFA
jgi:hypothetical protein